MSDRPLTEVWRGGVNAWECDEMGHMNTRYYLARCMEGATALLVIAGLAEGLAATALRETHIRFHREARAATALHMEGGLARLDDNDAELLLMLRHSGDGSLAATFRVTLAHEGPWPDAFRKRSTALVVDVPPQAKPRSVGSGVPERQDLERHTRIAMGAIMPADCDHRGRMLPQKFAGTVSDGVRQLTAPLREIVVEHAEAPVPNIGGAVLEMRVAHLGQPALGDLFEVRSAFRGGDARTLVLEHWMLDPRDGRRWGYMESIAVVFDIEKRVVVGITEAARAALKPFALPT
jgi:acyl-CoA thioester hydrolase